MRSIAILAVLLLLPVQSWALDLGANETGGYGGIEVVGGYVRHIQVPAVLAGNPSTLPDQDAIGSSSCLSFATTGTKYAYFQWEVPADMVIASGMTVEVDWVPFSANMTGTDSVGWIIAYGTRAEGEAVNGTLTSVPSLIDAGITRYVTTHTPHVLDVAVAANPIVHEDHMFFRITRDVGTDIFAGTACITAFEIIYTSDGFPETN